MFQAVKDSLRMRAVGKAFVISSLWLTSCYGAVAWGLNLDGEGHYALRGETQTKPGMADNRGMYQAIAQSFRLLGEARLHEKSSFFLEFRLFDKPQGAYLGDERLERCSVVDGNKQCEAIPQDVYQPAYKPYTPYVTKAYARYAFEYFIVEAGRRGRQWGLGLFLDAGNKPFARERSVFDGIAFDINIQKSQALGVSFGFDKLAETGTYVHKSLQETVGFGPNNMHDDINQFFLSIVYDDRLINAGSSLTKQIGIYGARVNSANVSKGGNQTDLTFVDLFTGFYYHNLVLQNEILFTLGKTADPNMRRLGGAYEKSAEPAVNKMSSIGFAGELSWVVASSGSYVGPEIYRQGDANRHLLFFDYAYAPGDADGYYDDDRTLESQDEDAKYKARNVKKRANTAKAIAFHGNFTPALIMFNGRSQLEDLKVDGIFDPDRIMNAQVYSFGYRYEDLSIGDFEAKMITGFLNETPPSEVTTYFDSQPGEKRPIGYYGNALGYELDLSYAMHFGKDVDLGIAGGLLLPGEAWKVQEDKKPQLNYLLQSHLSFNF